MANPIDEIFEGVIDIANKAGKKTTELVDVSKIKIDIAGINNEIKHANEKLGVLTYNAARKCGDKTLIDLCINELDSLYAKLEVYKLKLDEAKSVRRCVKCGTANGLKAVYCYVCGEKLVRSEDKAAAAAKKAAETAEKAKEEQQAE